MNNRRMEAPEPSSDARDRSRLVERFRGPLMSFFLRRVGDRAEAEDLTQETFSRMLTSAEAERLERAEAYVFTVAANLLRDRARRAAVRGLSLSLDDESGESLAAHPSLVEDRAPERVVSGQQELERAMQALEELGERTRDIFILARLEHMKQQEIARMFGMPVSTVEKHLIRAARHLAQRLGPK